jgi:hypothetical protein
MAEGLLEGALGGEEEKPEVEAPEPLAGIEAFAAAIAAKLAGSDPGVARKTEEFLADQSQLLKVQKRHLEEEHEARLHFLRGQAREVDIRRFGLRLRVGFQLFLVLVATVIGLGAAVMIHDAVTSRRVVIEPFHAPPPLAARGIDGTVVAAMLLDDLSGLQDATRSTSAARGLTGAWSGNIKLDVPETGISLGEISRLLRERFGHDVHIDGDLVETPTGGLSLTVRGNGVPTEVIRRVSAELGRARRRGGRVRLLQIPAGAVGQLPDHSWTQRGGNRVLQERRGECGARGARHTSEQMVRRNLEHWRLHPRGAGTRARGRQAAAGPLELTQQYYECPGDLGRRGGSLEGRQGHAQDRRRPPGTGPRNLLPELGRPYLEPAAMARGVVADAEFNAGVGTQVVSSGPIIADVYARLHDSEAADLALKTAKEDPDDLGGKRPRPQRAWSAGAGGRRHRHCRDRAGSFRRPLRTRQSLPRTPATNAGLHRLRKRPGIRTKPMHSLKSAGTYVDCYRFRADILDGRGNWPGLRRHMRRPSRLHPTCPQPTTRGASRSRSTGI